MKRCPTCSQTYPDETLKFCRVDGALLVNETSVTDESSATRILPGSETGETQTVPSTESQATTSVLGARSNSIAETEQIREIRSSTVGLVTNLKRHKIAVVILLLVIVAGIVGVSAYLHARNTEVAIESIAVLPFENRSNNPEEDYISDGITESIINSLTRLPKLKVIPASVALRYKGKEIDPQKIAEELRVNAVLSGRMVQRGDNVTINVELDDVRYGKQLWGDQYNRKVSDLLAVQNEIANEISQRLRSELSGEDRQKLIKSSTANPEAYQLYLKGNYFAAKYTKDGLQKGIDYFNQAIAIDPNYALAYNGLALYYIAANDWYRSPHDAMPKAREAAKKALAIDETLSDAHTSLGVVADWYDWDWATAEREYKRAIELNANDARPHEFYGWFLAEQGRVNEAIAEAKRGQQLDPISPETNVFLGQTLVFVRHYDEAIEQLHNTLELDSNYWLAHDFLGRTYEQKGRLPEAIAEFQRALQLEDAVPENRSMLGHAFALSGKKAEAQKIIDQLKELSAHSYVPPYNIAVVYAGLGDNDQAFAWLDRAYDERSFYLAWLKIDPQLDILRSDRRFADLVKRVGLPQ